MLLKVPGGGYKLNNHPQEICIMDIINAVAEPIKFTNCSSTNGCKQKPHNSHCKTHRLWKGLEHNVKNYFNNITIDDICNDNIKIENRMNN